MKAIILLILVIASFLDLTPQSRLGFSPSEIKKEFSHKKFNLESGYDSDGDYYIQIKDEISVVYYYFDANSKCVLTILFPDDQGALNYLVELYNKKYVIISPTRWKMYSGNGISDIKLVIDEEHGYFFLWTI